MVLSFCSINTLFFAVGFHLIVVCSSASSIFAVIVDKKVCLCNFLLFVLQVHQQLHRHLILDYHRQQHLKRQNEMSQASSGFVGSDHSLQLHSQIPMHLNQSHLPHHFEPRLHLPMIMPLIMLQVLEMLSIHQVHLLRFNLHLHIHGSA